MSGQYRYQYSYVDLEEVLKCPEEYIIPECLEACKQLWNKNIETFMVSNDDDSNIYVLIQNLSPNNKKIMEKLIERHPERYYYDEFRKTYGFSMPSKSKEDAEALVVLTAPFKMQDTVRFQTPEDFLDDYKRTDGEYIITENHSIMQDINPELKDAKLEDALKATGKGNLYVQSENRVYSSETFKMWHERYLKMVKEHPERTDKYTKLDKSQENNKDGGEYPTF